MQPAIKQLLTTTIICLIFIIGVKTYLQQYWNKHASTSESIQLSQQQECELNRGCKFLTAGFLIDIKSDRKISVLNPFKLTAKISSSEKIKSISASFIMQGMNMGLNEFTFRPERGDTWFTNVILPVCTHRRTDWEMKMHVNTDSGNQYILTLPVVVASR